MTISKTSPKGPRTIRGWFEFANGTWMPAIAWGSPLRTSAENHIAANDRASALSFIALGPKLEQAGHIIFGTISDSKIASSLGLAASHFSKSGPADSYPALAEEFQSSYSDLQEWTGLNGNNLGLVVVSHHERDVTTELDVALFGDLQPQQASEGLSVAQNRIIISEIPMPKFVQQRA